MALRSVKKNALCRPTTGVWGHVPQKILDFRPCKIVSDAILAKIARLGGLQNLAVVFASYNIIPRSQRLRRRGSSSYRNRMHERQARPLGARIASFPGFRKAYRGKWSG